MQNPFMFVTEVNQPNGC